MFIVHKQQELIITQNGLNHLYKLSMGACIGKKEPQDQTLLENAQAENQPQIKWDNKRSEYGGQSSRMNKDRSTLTRPEQAAQESRQYERVEATQVQSVVHQFRNEAPQLPVQSAKRQSKTQQKPVQMQIQQPINEQQHLDFVNRLNPLNFAIIVN